MKPQLHTGVISFLLAAFAMATAAFGQDVRVKLDPSMVTNEIDAGDPQAMVDEQDLTGDPPSGIPEKGWTIPSNIHKHGPVSAYINLGEDKPLASVWIYDLNGIGDLVISSGKPDAWSEVTTYDCASYKRWVKVPLDVTTQYLRFTRKDGGSNFTEVVLYAYTPEQWTAVQQRKAQEAQAQAEREAALARAKEEAKHRPMIDLGELFGELSLVDEIDVASNDPGHLFSESPQNASRVEHILGKPARVLNKTPGEAAYMTFRIGQYKLLKPGGAYVLEIEYPEDAPRGMIINNSGNESSLGFATGEALGDAFRPKYVDNLNESLRYPLSGEYKTWRMFFHLHDRFPDLQYVRGETGNRDLSPEDGFTVTIAQFSAENLPISHGAAVSRIRLYEVSDQSRLAAKYTLPPDDLPRRHLFWREEMADGVIHGEKNGTPAGVADAIDWYRFKADQMAFLGMNTYTKDLLEFGAVQGWNSSAHGGNQWAYFNGEQAGLWSRIVEMMGDRGYTVLPYYEYSGSKGRQGLGNQRRAKPLTRDDGFTHIKWIESANADLTDPDTYEDFRKMLDITIVREKDKAGFVGAWLRPRSQMPMGFGDSTRKRFAEEANGGQEVTRAQLKDDPELYAKYAAWWFDKRKRFFIAMRDYLRENGVDDATILYTGYPGEPGAGFKGPPVLVVDDVEAWKRRLVQSDNEREQKTEPITVQDVVDRDLYLTALRLPPANWGGWELQHANPVPDPQNYKDVEGVVLTHPFNRVYTASSPKTFDLFRAPAGLAIERHFSLNENMMFDTDDKAKLGYFAADIERNGPYCMAGEALAMANGDPRYIGYLVGRTYMRGFPEYVRNFNTAFLSLPALPSTRLDDASSDDEVVVRSIPTEQHGTYLAVVNTGMTDKTDVTITLPAGGRLTDAATGQAIESSDGRVRLTLYPFQLRALHIGQ